MAQPFNLIGKVMNKRASDFNVAAARVARSCAAEIGRSVAEETPVDTGVARSNWIMSIDEIATYVIPAYVPYPKTPSADYTRRAADKAAGIKHVLGTGDKEESANLVAVMSQHFIALQSYDPSRNRTIYIANNVPYIGLLNEGRSPQTAAGFVERSVDKGLAVVRRMKLMEP